MANATTALVGQGSSHLFQNAAGFDIVGGQFVLGDVHNHAGPGPVHTTSPLESSTEALSDSEIYYRQMLYQKRGFPLYVPGPKINLPAAYQRRGVAIGDVGRVTPEGVFDFFFNIFLAPNDPIHANRTPEGFSPLALYDPIDLLHESYDPGNSVFSSTVRKLDPDAPFNVFPGGQFVFRCDGQQGAVLALPDGADLQKLENLENIRAYAAEQADSWYKYINGARGRGLSNGDLYLVTGCEKARSWGMASFRAAREEFRLFFKPTPAAETTYTPYRWSGAQGQENPSRIKSHDPRSTNDPVNQTTFIHGLSISLPTGLWGKLFGTVQTASIVNFQSLLSSPGGSSAAGSQGSLFSWSFNLLSGRGAPGGKQHAGEHREAVLSDLSPTAMVLNPARLINEYILYRAPQSTGVVMSHDDDWSRVLDNDSDPSPSDFFRRIDVRFTITEKDGVTFLVPNPKPEQPGSVETAALEGPPSEIPNKVARAMYDFSGSGDDSELAFRAGDMIAVVDEHLDGWWIGELNGKQGLFPTSYTEFGPGTLQLHKHSGSSGNGAEMGISGPRYTEDDEDLSALPTFGSVSSTAIGPPSEQQAAPRKGSATVPGKSSRLPLIVACNFCRRRKIACDGRRPSCSTCVRRSLPCNYVSIVHDRNGRGDLRYTNDDEDLSDAATIIINILRDTDDDEEDLDAATLLTSVADDDERDPYDHHTGSSQMMQTTKRGRPFLQDTFDLYATLMVSLQLSPHKYFFKTFQNSFSTDEAIQNLSSLKFSKSSRNPDPREPSRLVTTTTTTTFSMTRPMAKAMSQHFMDARLIEDATDPSSHLFKNRGLYVLTPKGLYVLERFISKNGINSDHLQNVFVSQPICTELFHLERRLSDDEIIVTQSVITALFRRFVGRQPNYPNAPQDAFARHAERSRGVLLMDITDRAQPARSPQLHKHRFAAVAALEWLCDFTSVVGKEEAAEMAAQFVRFGLIALVGEEKTDATSVLVARSPAPDGNSPVSVSTHGEFRCTANSIYQVTDEGGRVAHWDDPTDEPDHENKKPTDRKIHRHIFIAEKLDHDAQKGTKESNTDRLMYILDEPALRSLFREFLKENFCEENLSFWLEVKDFKRKFDIASSVVAAIPAPSEPNRGATPGQGAMKKHYESLIQTAFLIYNKYLAPSSQCELNIDHGLRNELSKYLEEVVTSMTGKVFQGQVDQEQANAFDATELQTMIRLYERIQTHVFRLMATDSVPKFVKTPKLLAVRNWVEDLDSNADVDPNEGTRTAAHTVATDSVPKFVKTPKFLAVRNWVEDLNSNQDVDPNEGARAGAHTGPPGLAQAATSPRQPVSLASLKVAGNQTQPEVLHNFFQSLLSSKDRTGTGAGAVVKTSPEANGTGSEAEDAG